MHPQVQTYWYELDCGFKQVAEVFEECVFEALSIFNRAQMKAYLDAARVLGKLGRGPEPMLAFLEEWPSVVAAVKGDPLEPVMNFVRAMQKSPNGLAIAPFLQTLAAVARRLPSLDQLQGYIDIARDLMARTTGSIHGFQQTIPSPGLPEFFAQAPRLLDLLSLQGLRNWVEYGIRNHGSHPERQAEYFRLASPDSRAVMQGERHGTLFHDVERQLDLYLRALWNEPEVLAPYSTIYDAIRQPVPYYDKLGMRVPDVFDDAHGPLGTVRGIDRYRAVLAHMVGHRRWSAPQIADNWSPFQRMAVEFFEDARIDTLLMREFPGLGRIFLALHPKPVEGACDPETTSCLRHRLAMLSRACLDPAHSYRDAVLNEFVANFHARIDAGTAAMAELALAYVARTRRQSDQFARVHFDNTVVSYRDDNRQLWKFIEEGDEEEAFDEPRQLTRQEVDGLPPRHYPEWDYQTQTYRPDWVSLYEALHPSGSAAKIDRLLAKHDALAKRLKRLLDLLKPQDKVRIRYQEEGAELDLDIALRSLIDFRCGATPDPRINMSHKTSGRDIAVLLLLDLSESLNEKTPAGDQTILELSQEAVSLLAWAIERLGDPFAIAGFHSDTRHQVRYQHIKGFSERWSDDVKARLAAMEAGWSTRMGAAMRHAGHYLGARQADKKLLLILTDGRPSDIDSPDERHLVNDARQAVRELERQGIFSYCINLDCKADEYVADVFGKRHSVIDHVERLPQKLPELFMALTR
ncbi:MAG: VWA domain-containing protein [Rhodocyclaceae bacterium]|nr:VWA domain-containing protein [Rhodocyclaceae bacterium]MBK9312394.1 VWA domain-containing protein [Rhodocyclaceae bacterium]MBK9953932.1 VWA domain-containing protein [Rhodocyclaceae bacterium]